MSIKRSASDYLQNMIIMTFAADVSIKWTPKCPDKLICPRFTIQCGDKYKRIRALLLCGWNDTLIYSVLWATHSEY